MRCILLTGANGVLGTALLRLLLPQSKVIAVSGDPRALKVRFSEATNLSCFGWDELDDICWDQIEAVIHCAFSRTLDGKELTRSLELTCRLLKKVCIYAPHASYVNISSRSVYGQNPCVPWTEDTVPEPGNMYALGKVGQEYLTRQAAEHYGFTYTTLRLAGLIGPGMEKRIVSKMVMQAIHNHCLKVVGGKQQFAMLDLRDAAAGIMALLDTDPHMWKAVYNFGSDRVYQLSEIAHIIQVYAKDAYGLDIQLDVEPKDITLIDNMDCSRFYLDTGWRPQYQLVDTVELLFKYYMEQSASEPL